MSGSRHHRGVLVTGAHRSGTTWLGRLLAAADDLHYVQEPFNIVARLRWTSRRPPHQFQYVHDGDVGWGEELKRAVELRPPVAAQLIDTARRRRLRRLARVTLDARRARSEGRRPLLKDPIALFSTPWLVERFNLEPVVLVRDPVSFVGSLQARDWGFDFRHWTNQPHLMNDLLGDWADDITRQVDRPGSIVDQGIVQWNAFYGVVDRFRTEHPEWIVRRYEELAAAPGDEIPALYDQLGLTFGPKQRTVLEDLSTGSGGVGKTAIDVRRNSAAALETWRQRLSDEEIVQIRTETAEIAARFGIPT